MNEHVMIPCRRCQAPMFFAITTKNKRIPLDAMPTENGNVILGEPQEPYGYRLAMVLGPGDRPKDDTPRYTSHFATCPYATSFRR